MQQTAAHKEELTALKAAYNDSIDRLKAEMLALIEERAASAETSKREYESQLLAVKRLHHGEMEHRQQLEFGGLGFEFGFDVVWRSGVVIATTVTTNTKSDSFSFTPNPGIAARVWSLQLSYFK